MLVPNDMAMHPIDVETFHSKPQMSILWWQYGKRQGITNYVGLNHLETFNVLTKCDASHSSRC